MHKISIRTVIIAMTLLVTMLTMLLYNAVYGNMTDKAFSELDLTIVTQNVEQTKEQLDAMVSDAENLLSYITDSVLMHTNFSPTYFREIVTPLVQTKQCIHSVALYTESGSCVSMSTDDPSDIIQHNHDTQNQAWFQNTLHLAEISYSGAHLDHSIRGKYNWVVTLSRQVNYRNADNIPQSGVLAVHIYLSAIEDICIASSASSPVDLVLADRDGATIYSMQRLTEALPTLSDIYRNTGLRTEDQQLLHISQPLENEHWILTGLTREDHLQQTSNTVQRKGITVLCLSMLLALILSMLISSLVCKPFRYMENTMLQTESGISGLHLRKYGYKEFISLITTYNQMLSRIEHLMEEARSHQEQLRTMEIAALEDQINPHFLYNALDSITWLIETDRRKDAVATISALARLLRLSINRGGNFHTVSREVEHIHNYLIIQKTRYGQRFSSSIHVEKDAEALLCPRLILQPIVENAIKHGIGDNEDCQIIIRVFMENGRLIMTIWDDGMGLMPDKLREVQSALRETQPPDPEQITGLALKSINRRIRLLCGEAYGILIESETEEWTCVRIELPCQ